MISKKIIAPLLFGISSLTLTNQACNLNKGFIPISQERLLELNQNKIIQIIKNRILETINNNQTSDIVIDHLEYIVYETNFLERERLLKVISDPINFGSNTISGESIDETFINYLTDIIEYSYQQRFDEYSALYLNSLSFICISEILNTFTKNEISFLANSFSVTEDNKKEEFLISFARYISTKHNIRLNIDFTAFLIMLRFSDYTHFNLECHNFGINHEIFSTIQNLLTLQRIPYYINYDSYTASILPNQCSNITRRIYYK